MAPIILLSNPEIFAKLPNLFTISDDSLIFYLNDLVKLIELVNSLPPVTQLVIYFVSDQSENDSFAIENPLMDGLLALLLSLETFITEFQFNWITLNTATLTTAENVVNVSSVLKSWKDAFPFINFIDSNGKMAVNSLQLPQIGQIQIDSPLILSQFTPANAFKIMKKDQVKGFLSTASSSVFNLKTLPVIPAKLQINLESDGILFQLQNDLKTALIFLDPLLKTVSFIEPVYVPYMKKFLKVTVKNISLAAAEQPTNKWLDNSFSLSDWPAEDSIDQDTLKKNNKLKLKKLILLSLRGMGIKKNDKNFLDIWKHLYCGCIFSLRKELSCLEIDQTVLLKTIKENIKFLNL